MLKYLIYAALFFSMVKGFCEDKSDDKAGPPEYKDEHGEYIIIDDMYIRKDPSRAGLVNNAWPNGIVPYTLDGTLTSRQVDLIREAIADISRQTCIQFRVARQNDRYSLLYRNYSNDNGCHSRIGFQNQKNQPIQFSLPCSKGNAVHETIHALGFYHEHVREDRDDYVYINCDNVIPGQEHNFNKLSEMSPNIKITDYGILYNYESIMHYPLRGFAIDKTMNTIELLNQHPPAIGDINQVGQRDHLSQGDIDMINTKYKCDSVDNTEEKSTSTNSPVKTTTTATVKPTTSTKNPLCQKMPNLPICKSP